MSTSPTLAVGVSSVTTPTDLEVVMRRVFDAPRRLIFDAWTNPEHLRLWLLGPGDWSMTRCEVDLRPDGEWRFGWQRPEGPAMEIRGVYQDVAPPERLTCTESWGGDWPETLNTLELAETAGKTTITHTIRYPSRAARDAALRTRMIEGMSAGFARLDEFLASGS